MSQPCVLCIGEVLFDCLADSTSSVNPQELEEVKSWTPYPGGAPANVAAALVKLGSTASFIGCVGEDSPGKDLVNLLQQLGVGTSGIQRHLTAPTRQVYVLRNPGGDRSFVGFGEIDTTAFADTHLQASKLPVDLFENANFLVLGSLELAYPESREAINQAVSLANQHHIKILLDVNRRDMFWPDPEQAIPLIKELLNHVDFLKLSDEEAEWLFATSDPKAIAQKLDHLEGVLITAGEKGCSYFLSDNVGQIPAFAVPVVDTTGAGDSFVAGFIHQLCKHSLKQLADPQTALCVVTYASAVGALTTMKAGAIASQPTHADVKAFLQSHASASRCWQSNIWE